jgi:hypothetical protein
MTIRISPLGEAPAPVTVTATPGDWPGPTMNDLPCPV